MRFAFHALGAVIGSALVLSCAGTTSEPQSEAKAPLYSCYRHIYNQSGCPWTFSANDDATQYGNVYFGDGNLPNCTQKNGPCTIAANSSIEIQYTTTRGSAQGVLNIIDQTGDKHSYVYSNPNVDQCAYIRHEGNTGAVTLNDPANGDMAAGQCTWKGAK